jgi:hypothetical protein
MDHSKSSESAPPLRPTASPAAGQSGTNEAAVGSYSGLSPEQLAVWELLAAEPPPPAA